MLFAPDPANNGPLLISAAERTRLGAIAVVVAASLSIIFGATRNVNFAHGSPYVSGVYRGEPARRHR